jgi:hypothetical protein
MSTVVIAHTSISTSGTNLATTAPIDTTGANAIYMFGYSVFGVGPPTDSKGNVWTDDGDLDSTCNGGAGFTRCFNPVVGTGHTFSVTGNASFTTQLLVLALRVQNPGSFLNIRANSQVNPVQCSIPITAPVDNLVLVSCAVAGCGWTSLTVDSGFTIIEQQPNIGMAYLIGAISTSINPTWTTLTSGGIGGSTGGVVLESMGVFIPTGGNWQVYEA